MMGTRALSRPFHRLAMHDLGHFLGWKGKSNSKGCAFRTHVVLQWRELAIRERMSSFCSSRLVAEYS